MSEQNRCSVCNKIITADQDRDYRGVCYVHWFVNNAKFKTTRHKQRDDLSPGEEARLDFLEREKEHFYEHFHEQN